MSSIPNIPVEAAQAPSTLSSVARRYALAVIFVVSLLNFMDRSIVAILQEPIKRDLGLSDTQVGALTGLAFGLVYAGFALPLGWLADRTVRKVILAIAVGVWSAMTGLSGFAMSFAAIVVLRMGVAVGEAASVPVTHSLIADYYPLEKRAQALSFWAVTISLGTMLSFLGGGWLESEFGWRGALVIVGLIGLAISPLVLTLREPARGEQDLGLRLPPPQRLGLAASLRIIWARRALRWLALAAVFNAYVLFANQFWTASFYIRVYDLPLATVATMTAFIVGLGGGAGAMLGGAIAGRLARKDHRWYGWLPAIATACAIPTGVAQFFVPSLSASVAFGFVTMLLLNVFMPLAPTIHQSIVPANVRAFTSAVMLVVSNVVGVAFGPLLTGLISDLIASRMGADSLRYAVAVSFVFAALACFAYFKTGQHLKAEMPSGETRPGSQAGNNNAPRAARARAAR